MFKNFRIFSRSAGTAKLFVIIPALCLILIVSLNCLAYLNKEPDTYDLIGESSYLVTEWPLISTSFWAFMLINSQNLSPNSGKLARTYPNAVKKLKAAIIEYSSAVSAVIALTGILSAAIVHLITGINVAAEMAVTVLASIFAGGLLHLNNMLSFARLDMVPALILWFLVSILYFGVTIGTVIIVYVLLEHSLVSIIALGAAAIAFQLIMNLGASEFIGKRWFLQ